MNILQGITHPPIEGSFSFNYKDDDDTQSIEKVMYRGSELKKISPVSLLDEDERAAYEKSKENCKDWEKFTLKQVAALAAIAAAYCKHYINDNSTAALKNTLLPSSVRRRINPYIIGGIVDVGITALALSSFVKYFSLFQVSNFEESFPCTQVEEKIAVFRRRTFSHSVRYGDVIIHYYNYSDPLGYMPIKEYEVMKHQFEKINRCFSISCLIATLSAGGMFLAAEKKVIV